jgi:hypothetical protein
MRVQRNYGKYSKEEQSRRFAGTRTATIAQAGTGTQQPAGPATGGVTNNSGTGLRQPTASNYIDSASKAIAESGARGTQTEARELARLEAEREARKRARAKNK